MSDSRKIIVWFLVCLVLAVYAKLSGLAPVNIGMVKTGTVLGSQYHK